MNAKCPPLEVLLRMVRDGGSDAVRQHVRACEFCGLQLEAIRLAIDLPANVEAGITPDCLDEVSQAELADGKMPVDRSSEAVEHLAQCGYCRSQVGSLMLALADDEIRSAIPDSRRAAGTARYVAWAGLAAAAVAAVIWVGITRAPGDPLSGHRGPTLTGAAAPVAIEPVGAAATADLFQWRTVPGADRYEVVVLDGQGRLVWSEQTRDTVLPFSGPLLESGRPFFWQLRARVGFGRWTDSDMIEFQISNEARRP